MLVDVVVFLATGGFRWWVMTESAADERTLIQRAGRGERAAFDALMRMHRESVFRTVYFRILGYAKGSAAEDALDITQEVFLRAYRAVSRWRPEAKFSTWLQCIALNLASNYCRDRGRRGEVVGGMEAFTLAAEASAPGLEAECDEISSIVMQSLKDLSGRQREVFIMRHFNEMPLKEIAQATGCSVSAVKTHLARAVVKLRDALESAGYSASALPQGERRRQA